METQDLMLDSCDCEPFVTLPAWWSSFLFQVFSPRQLAVYTYIAMLGIRNNISTPTIKQIRDDMGLASDTMVYEALRALEEGALIRRIRVRNDGGIVQNGYRRPACESTLISLIEGKRIDYRLRPIGVAAVELQSEEVSELAREGLESLLGDDFALYGVAPPSDRRERLLALLRASLSRRRRSSRAQCSCAFGETDDATMA